MIIKESDRTGKKAKVAEADSPPSSGPPPRKRHLHSASSDSLMKEFDKLLKEGAADGWVDTESRKGEPFLHGVLLAAFEFSLGVS